MDEGIKVEDKDFELLFWLNQHRWSDLCLFANGEQYWYRVSHVFTDPISDIVEFTLAILRKEPSLTIVLPYEPGETTLRYQIDDRDVDTVCLEFFDHADIGGTKHLDSPELCLHVGRARLLWSLYYQLAKTADLCEFDPYHRASTVFPMKRFQKLRKIYKTAKSSSQ